MLKLAQNMKEETDPLKDIKPAMDQTKLEFENTINPTELQNYDQNLNPNSLFDTIQQPTQETLFRNIELGTSTTQKPKHKQNTI